jgi:SAM-dependent methyltransferase
VAVEVAPAVSTVNTCVPPLVLCQQFNQMKSSPTNPTVQEFVSELARGKNVLDLGCADHYAEADKLDTWLHRHIARSANSILGVDILEEEVADFRKRGYNMISGDAVSCSLDRKFDLVIAGELIEHVGNPGGLVANMARHLNENGRLVITTPHAFFLQSIVAFWMGLSRKLIHPQHVGWFCRHTLRALIERNDCEVEQEYYFIRSRKVRAMLNFLHVRCPGFLASTIVAVAKKKPPQLPAMK